MASPARLPDEAFLALHHWAKGEQERALEYGTRGLELAASRDDVALRVTARLAIGLAQHALGQYADGARTAREMRESLAVPGVTEHFALPILPYCAACALEAECLAELGDHRGALGLLDDGDRIAASVSDVHTLMALGSARGEVLVTGGPIGEAVARLEATVGTCREGGNDEHLASALGALARAYVAAGRFAEARSAVEEAIQRQDEAKVYVYRTRRNTVLARAHLGLGDLDRTEQTLGIAFEFAERNGERGDEGWARLAAADLALRRGDAALAEQYIDESQEIAEELGMMPLVERCRAMLRRLG
jgi:tetratricopeptide (TPR) repeat protein